MSKKYWRRTNHWFILFGLISGAAFIDEEGARSHYRERLYLFGVPVFTRITI